MARLSALILLSCALAGLLSCLPAHAAAVATTGRSLTDTTVAAAPEGDVDSAEDAAEETEQEAEEVGADIEDGTETAVDETEQEAEEVGGDIADGTTTAVDETEQEAEEVGGDIKNGTETAVDETEQEAEEVGDDIEDAFTDSAAGTSFAIAVSAAFAGLAALAA